MESEILELEQQYLFEQPTPEKVLEKAIHEYKPIRVFACFSGGNDSLTTTHFAMKHGAQEVVHINTGIGIEATREFVRETCKEQGWPLRELYPPDSTFEDVVLKYGFPGPGGHRYAYSWLKERALRKLVRETKTQLMDKVVLVTGVRNQESARRMGYVQTIYKSGATVWVAPMFNYSKIHLHQYRKEFDLKQSPVVEKFHMSGECLCGAFAHEGEMKEIELHFPEVAKRIHALEDRVRSLGIKYKGKKVPDVWGHMGSLDLDDENEPDYSLFMPLCVGCNESKIRENR